jgi:hypothetical protein
MAGSSVESTLPAGGSSAGHSIDWPATDQGIHEQSGHWKGLFVRTTPGPASFFDRRIASAGLDRPEVNYGHARVRLAVALHADPNDPHDVSIIIFSLEDKDYVPRRAFSAMS